ncbi:MAG: lytic polysaccharide monooxygenase [Myxococcales bacterium]|nr:lytic polysaccharide monooxygenase [Myxococcales bacterium]
MVIFTMACAAMVLGGSDAHAHLSLEQAGSYSSRHGDSQLKAGPCGVAGSTRGTNVHTFQAGETITISVVEFIPHPGYFRIAFDQDGDDDFLPPQSIEPIGRECMAAEGDRCGTSDFYNNETVLLDNLEPHGAGEGVKTYSWEVTLPDVECDGCTLQVIQLMMDKPPYDPNETSIFGGDIYYQCIDVVLERSADAATAGAGGTAGAAATAGSGGDGAAAGAGGAVDMSANSGAGGVGGAGAGVATPAEGGGGAAGMETGLAAGGAAGDGTSGADASGGDGGGCRASSGPPSGGAAAYMALALWLTRRRRSVRRS